MIRTQLNTYPRMDGSLPSPRTIRSDEAVMMPRHSFLKCFHDPFLSVDDGRVKTVVPSELTFRPFESRATFMFSAGSFDGREQTVVSQTKRSFFRAPNPLMSDRSRCYNSWLRRGRADHAAVTIELSYSPIFDMPRRRTKIGKPTVWRQGKTIAIGLIKSAMVEFPSPLFQGRKAEN
jgi:hypothetical protein